MTALFESSATYGTFKRLYVGVSSHVLTKVHRLRETLAAYHTLEWLHLGVSAEVLVQPCLLRESFRAKRANKGTDARVHPHVLL